MSADLKKKYRFVAPFSGTRTNHIKTSHRKSPPSLSVRPARLEPAFSPLHIGRHVQIITPITRQKIKQRFAFGIGRHSLEDTSPGLSVPFDLSQASCMAETVEDKEASKENLYVSEPTEISENNQEEPVVSGPTDNDRPRQENVTETTGKIRQTACDARQDVAYSQKDGQDKVVGAIADNDVNAKADEFDLELYIDDAVDDLEMRDLDKGKDNSICDEHTQELSTSTSCENIMIRQYELPDSVMKVSPEHPKAKGIDKRTVKDVSNSLEIKSNRSLEKKKSIKVRTKVIKSNKSEVSTSSTEIAPTTDNNLVRNMSEKGDPSESANNKCMDPVKKNISSVQQTLPRSSTTEVVQGYLRVVQSNSNNSKRTEERNKPKFSARRKISKNQMVLTNVKGDLEMQTSHQRSLVASSDVFTFVSPTPIQPLNKKVKKKRSKVAFEMVKREVLRTLFKMHQEILQIQERRKLLRSVPRGRAQRQQYYQPSLEQEFVNVLGDLLDTRRPTRDTGHCCPPGKCTRRDNSVYQPFWTDLVGLGSRRPWVHVLNMTGFEASDIDVKVEEGSILVSARREERDGANADLLERKREVKLPQDVDVEKIACFLADDGRFIIKAPYISKKQQQPREIKSESKHPAPQEAIEVPIRREGEEVAAKQEQAEARTPTTSLADFIVSALTGDYPGEGDSEGPVPGDDYVMLNGAEGEKRELSPLADTTCVCEEDGKKVFCVKVKLPNYPPESIKVRCHGRSMYVDAKREVEESGIYHCHEFHRRYTLPENAADEGAKAQMDDSGMITVKVPLLELNAPESQNIPIERAEQKSVEEKQEETTKPEGEEACQNKELCKDECKGECKPTDKPEGQ